jgi:hypothetical protein
MSYNGSGTFNINTTGQPVVAGTIISAATFNALTADLATGLTTALTKDGQTTATARIPFAQGITSTLTTDSSSTATGSIITAGGVGIAKKLYVGTDANIAGALTVSGDFTVTNPIVNNLKLGYTTTATAAGTTTLTVASNYRQLFTGSTTQTLVLPVTSTLALGMAYVVENNSSGSITVQSSGFNTVATVIAGATIEFTCILVTGTTAASWDYNYVGFGTVTGTGSNVLATSPTLITPLLGTPTSGILSSCTVDGTNEVGYKNIPQNSQSAAYTLVLSDAGKHIFHPSTDANARTFTIPANSSVAYPIGTAITFINMTSAVVTIAITTDTMYLSSAGTTGSRSLAQYGSATAIKMTSTTWLISGSGLT